jgi:hypothetical protein
LPGFFDPENGGDMFLRNVGRLSTDYTASYPKKIELFITTAVRTSDHTQDAMSKDLLCILEMSQHSEKTVKVKVVQSVYVLLCA